MNTMLFLLLIFTVALIAILVDRRIQRLKQEQLANRAADEGEAGATPATPATKVDLDKRFRLWSRQAFAHEPAMQRWIEGLSEPGLAGLVESLQLFCHEMGVELTWLVEQDLSHHPDTQRQLSTMIWHYCQACHNAIAAHKEAAVLQVWYAFAQNPTHNGHKPLLQALASELTEQSLIPPLPPDVITAPPPVRQRYLVQQIQEVAQTEPARFYKILPSAIAAAQANPEPSLLEQAFQKAFATVRLAKNRANGDSVVTNGA